MPTQTGTSLTRYLSDGSPDGTSFAQSSTDLITIYNGTPVAQPSGNAQAALVRGNQAGVIATYSTAQTPSAVSATFSTAEQVLTVQTGTGAQMLIASGDLLFVNKPTSQAGLGVGNIRVSASNTVGVTFTNVTSASITPSSAESYSVVALRGLGAYKLSATLSPVAVAASSTVEQQFTVTGLPVGSLVQVNKPTAQAGLDIGGCRVVSNNVLGITFINPTSAAITPTSGEIYSVTALPGLDAVNNDVMYGMNVGTPGAISGLVVTGGSTTVSGVLATDFVQGIFKPTAQSAATNFVTPAQAIPTANTITLYFSGIGTGGTPTSGEVYGIRTARLNPVAPLVVTNPTLTASATIGANSTSEQIFSSVSGLVVSSPVWVNKPSYTSGIAVMGCRVTSGGTLAITYANVTSAAVTLPTETYTVGNFQVPAPGNGNCVYQCVSPTLNGLGNLANSLRSALGPTGLAAIAGA